MTIDIHGIVLIGSYSHVTSGPSELQHHLERGDTFGLAVIQVELHTVSVQARNDIPACSAQSEEGRPILMDKAAVVLRQLQFSVSGPWLLSDYFQGDVYVIPR